MLKKVSRLFLIKTRLEAYAVIYALALGAVSRGHHYLQEYPGAGGWLLFLACTGAVFMAGAKILDSTERRSRRAAALQPSAPYPDGFRCRRRSSDTPPNIGRNSQYSIKFQ